MFDELALGHIVFKALAPAAINTLAKKFATTTEKIKARLGSTFVRHIELSETKCSRVKTIFSGQEFIPLNDIYVNLNIRCRDKEWRDEDIVLRPEDVGSIVITGTGGAGKTMLMKFAAGLMLRESRGTIPLFIELRNLPKHDPNDFYETIFKSVTREENFDQFSLFKEGLRAGVFTLLLDGLDEVHPSTRQQVFANIQRIGLDFPKTRVIASTRPEIDTRSWDTLDTYDVVGLTLDQARLLIGKISFPDELKTAFLSLLDATFFEKHRTFLEVPLLCSLMLLTYNEYKTVPSRITVFYDQAFETLFRRHDLQKEGYFSRDLLSKLPSDRFRSIFSAFCYRTLALNQLSFSDDNLRNHLAKAASECEIEVNVDDYAKDLVSAVCMLMRDGLDLHFIHRSFQEYFAAVYVLRYRGNDTFNVISRLVSDIIFNDVLSMAYDMEPKTIEREWIAPALGRIAHYLKRFPKKDRPYRLIKKTTYALKISGNPPSIISSYSWIISQTFRRWLYELEKIRPLNFQPSFYYRQYRMEAGSLCDLKVSVEAWPTGLRDVCQTGVYPETQDEDTDDDELVIPIGELDQRWFEETPMQIELLMAIDRLFEFEAEIKRRVQERERISLLD